MTTVEIYQAPPPWCATCAQLAWAQSAPNNKHCRGCELWFCDSHMDDHVDHAHPLCCAVFPPAKVACPRHGDPDCDTCFRPTDPMHADAVDQRIADLEARVFAENKRKAIAVERAEKAETALRKCVEGLEHMEWCSSCAQGGWGDCDGGRDATNALAAAREVLGG